MITYTQAESFWEQKIKKAKIFAELSIQGALKKDIPIKYVGSKESESIKLFANTYLAMRIAFF